ncbi:amidase signature domain-containing protein [Biscogniauxia marginata]|nr:amidase signature domain-containing protein [Biscogniauxia marginata]
MSPRNELVSTGTWPEFRAAKKAKQDLTVELMITGDAYDATSLAEAVKEGKLTAVEVVTAFCKHAAVGHQLCNMLTEIMFADAIEKAKKLDAIFMHTRKLIGSLHGLLQIAGVVFIAKTNVFQTMSAAERHNNGLGRTKNLVNSRLTCGGSSSGEGASQAFRCSVLGIGTDVRGCIRMPAAANAVFGYKPPPNDRIFILGLAEQ